jgi:dipeptide/tripeptide permease
LAAGYSNAFSAIFDSNLTSVITGIILFNFGTGPIKGFATTLIIGIVVSFFTAVFMTRLVYSTMMEKGKWHNLKFKTPVGNWISFKDPKFKFMAAYKTSFAIFGALANKGKEPSAPRKIGLGMFVAGAGFLILALGSLGLASPKELGGTVSPELVSPYWLISTYLVLTFAELLLSPMGISFVSKVAPPKYKGMMMGGWFAATAIGNYLVSVPGLLWMRIPLWSLWLVLIVICLVAGVFMFANMKRIESATK